VDQTRGALHLSSEFLLVLLCRRNGCLLQWQPSMRRAAAPALFADSVAVGGSLSVAQSIHTQGVTGASGTPLALDSDLGITILAGSFSGPFGAVIAGATGQVGIVATDKIVMDSPRVKIEELLQLTPTVSYAATPENGDIWFEEVSSTQANLKIYYNGSWRTILSIP
jgi:hypothetical protein